MTRHRSAYRALLAAPLLCLLPLGMAAAQENTATHQVDPKAGFTSVSREYADMNAPYSRGGVEKTIAGIRSVLPGMSRPELERALGQPVLGRGDGSAEFHLSLSLTGRDRLICQYRVFFDAQDKVERAVWRRPQCADLVWSQAR